MNSTTTTQTEMIDAQARVIRSLNLVHSADTQYMIGAVQLENLFKLKTENDELRQRMKDDGEYICTLSERCGRYRDALMKHKAENERLAKKIEQLYEGAEEQNQRIKMLVDAGDALKTSGYFGGWADAVNKWVKVKEGKP